MSPSLEVWHSIFWLSGWKKLLVKLLHKIIFCEIEIINILNFALCFSSFPSTDFNLYTDFITQLILWCIIYIFILIPKVMIFSLKMLKPHELSALFLNSSFPSTAPDTLQFLYISFFLWHLVHHDVTMVHFHIRSFRSSLFITATNCANSTTRY